MTPEQIQQMAQDISYFQKCIWALALELPEPVWRDVNAAWNKVRAGYEAASAEQPAERFKKPTDEQIVKTALIFNDGKLDAEELTNMVSMSMFVVDRLYENGDITIPSSKEK